MFTLVPSLLPPSPFRFPFPFLVPLMLFLPTFFSPSPLFAANPDPDLDANSIPLAWKPQAAAPVLVSLSFCQSNATTGTLSYRALDTLLELSLLFATT